MTRGTLAQTAPLFDFMSGAPDGLRYVPGFLTPREEEDLLAHVEEIDFTEVRMHGVAARRTTAHFGWNYDYDSRKLDRPEPIPDFLLELRQRAADLVDLLEADFGEVLVSRYPE